MQWFYSENGNKRGPVEFEQLAILASTGSLKLDDYVWNKSMGKKWSKADAVQGLFDEPPPLPSEGNLKPDNPNKNDAEHTFNPTSRSMNLQPVIEPIQDADENGELMTMARSALAGMWGKAIAIFIMIIVSKGLLMIYTPYTDMVMGEAIPSFAEIICIVTIFSMSAVLSLWLMWFCLRLSRHEAVKSQKVFDSLQSLKCVVLFYVLALPGIICGGLWSSHMFVPFIFLYIVSIVIWLNCSQSIFILMDDPSISPLKAIMLSIKMMSGNKLDLFGLTCRFIGWALLCILTLGIGFLWLVPYYIVTMACFYDKVKKVSNICTDVSETEQN